MSGTDSFYKKIETFRADFESALSGLISERLPSGPRYLYEPLAYSLAGSAKRLRPILVRLTGEAFAADSEDLTKAGLAVELLHNFTLVHDDIMDGDKKRHGQETVHQKWDDSTAILAGDGLFAFSQLLIGSVKVNPVASFLRFNEATLQVCEGQGYDKEFEQDSSITLDQYLVMVEKKTGNLIGLCAELGAILGGQPEDVSDELYSYGLTLGKAFQIQDDILEITADAKSMGKSLGSDIAAGKQTILTILAKDQNPTQWEQFTAGINTDNDAELCGLYRNYYSESGILALAENRAEELFHDALKSLEVVPGQGRQDLADFTGLVLKRQK